MLNNGNGKDKYEKVIKRPLIQKSSQRSYNQKPQKRITERYDATPKPTLPPWIAQCAPDILKSWQQFLNCMSNYIVTTFNSGLWTNLATKTIQISIEGVKTYLDPLNLSAVDVWVASGSCDGIPNMPAFWEYVEPATYAGVPATTGKGWGHCSDSCPNGSTDSGFCTCIACPSDEVQWGITACYDMPSDPTWMMRYMGSWYKPVQHCEGASLNLRPQTLSGLSGLTMDQGSLQFDMDNENDVLTVMVNLTGNMALSGGEVYYGIVLPSDFDNNETLAQFEAYLEGGITMLTLTSIPNITTTISLTANFVIPLVVNPPSKTDWIGNFIVEFSKSTSTFTNVNLTNFDFGFLQDALNAISVLAEFFAHKDLEGEINSAINGLVQGIVTNDIPTTILQAIPDITIPGRFSPGNLGQWTLPPITTPLPGHTWPPSTPPPPTTHAPVQPKLWTFTVEYQFNPFIYNLYQDPNGIFYIQNYKPGYGTCDNNVYTVLLNSPYVNPIGWSGNTMTFADCNYFSSGTITFDSAINPTQILGGNIMFSIDTLPANGAIQAQGGPINYSPFTGKINNQVCTTPPSQ